MSDAKMINEQLHKLLYQHEMGAIDKTQYRQLRAKLVDGFTVTLDAQRHEQKTAIQQNRRRTKEGETSAFALFITVMLVLGAVVLLVYSFKGSPINGPQAQTTTPILVDEKQ